MKKTAAALCAALLTLTACGASAEDEAKENIKAGVLEGDSAVAGGLELSEEQAQCFADGLVDEVGVEKLQDYGILNEDNEVVADAEVKDMSAEDAEASAEVVTGCVDIEKLVREQIDAAAGAELTEEQADCVLDVIDEDTIEAAIAAQLQGEEAGNPLGDSMGALMQCVTGGPQRQ